MRSARSRGCRIWASRGSSSRRRSSACFRSGWCGRSARTAAAPGSGPSGRCRNCGGSGYRGRTGIYELLRIDDELRGAIVAKRPSGEINEIARRNGMIPLLEDGRSKVDRGITTEAELLRIAAGV